MVRSIAVDAMGGDDAPSAIVLGAAEASVSLDAEIVDDDLASRIADGARALESLPGR